MEYARINFDVGERTYTAIGKSYYKGYKGSREEPPEAPEMEFVIEDEHGVEIVDFNFVGEAKLNEISNDLISAYLNDIKDHSAEDQLNKILGK